MLRFYPTYLLVLMESEGGEGGGGGECGSDGGGDGNDGGTCGPGDAGASEAAGPDNSGANESGAKGSDTDGSASEAGPDVGGNFGGFGGFGGSRGIDIGGSVSADVSAAAATDVSVAATDVVANSTGAKANSADTDVDSDTDTDSEDSDNEDSDNNEETDNDEDTDEEDEDTDEEVAVAPNSTGKKAASTDDDAQTVGMAAISAAMANNANPSTAGKATNGMSAGQLAGLSAAGLGNVAISSSQTVDMALGSLGVGSMTAGQALGLMGALASGNLLGAISTFSGLVGGSTVSSVTGVAAALMSGNPFAAAGSIASALGAKDLAAGIGIAGNLASGNYTGAAATGLAMTGNTQAAAAMSALGGAIALSNGNAFGAMSGAVAAMSEFAGTGSSNVSAGTSSSAGNSFGGGFSGGFSGGSSNANAGTSNDSDPGHGMEGDFNFTLPPVTPVATHNGQIPTHQSPPVLTDSSKTYIQQIADSLARNAQQGYLNSPKNDSMQPTFEPIFSKKDGLYSFNYQDTFGTDHNISLNEVKGFPKLKAILDAHTYSDPTSGIQEIDQRATRAAWNHPDVQTQVYNQISTNVVETLSNSPYFLGNIYENIKKSDASTLFGMPKNYQDIPSLNLTQEVKKLGNLGANSYTQQAQSADLTSAIFSEGILHDQISGTSVRRIGLDDLITANIGPINYNPKVGLYTKKAA